jgi:fermentation-respiration switch protein FrsA (DUF1100 family)
LEVAMSRKSRSVSFTVRVAGATDGVRDITTPIFLVHGEGRYPGSPQSANFAKELEKNYKVFRYKTYPGETYYVAGRANTRQMLLDMAEFLNQHLKDRVVIPTTGTSAGR